VISIIILFLQKFDIAMEICSKLVKTLLEELIKITIDITSEQYLMDW
jgi:hypothetical protein